MLKTWLTAKSKGATAESPNKPTEGSGPRQGSTRSFLLNMLGVVWSS